MKTTSGFGRWGPVAGVLAVGFLAFSLSLEGAAPSPQPAPQMKEKAASSDAPVLIRSIEETEAARLNEVTPDAATPKTTGPVRSGHAVSSLSTSESPLAGGVKFGRLPTKDLPVFETMVVDYRDDTGTRLREAGQLVGPYRPDQGAVAAGGCSFDIQCDDCNPCTNDVCQIDVGDPIGTGTCTNDVLPNGAEGGCSDGLCCNGRETCQAGVCEAPGAGTGIFDPGACQFPCSGGTVCNEDSNLCRLPCTGANTCAITGGPCTSTLDCPSQTGNYCLNCNDGIVCNGTETCVSGVCESGTNPCGPGAICGERDCSSPGVQICTTDSDCSAAQLGTCSVLGPICQHGRCCANATAEPVCSKRSKSGLCAGGTNARKPCVVNADCPGSSCTGGTASCDGQGGVWYATDNGFLPVTGGNVCPTPAQADPPNDRTICPKYSSGIAPAIDFETDVAFVVGGFSQGPCHQDDIGDDYQIENDSPIAMEKFRWVGGGGGRLLVEFYDEFGNFVEDIVTGGISGAIGVRSLNFLPPLTIPSRGFVVIRVAYNFAPNGVTAWVATDAFDEGDNLASGANSLWFNGAPSSMQLRECVGGDEDGAWCDPADLGDSECVGGGGVCQNRNNILAFEIEGGKVALPTGACCNNGTGTCTPGVAPWVCSGQGNNYLGNGTGCPGTCGMGACCQAGVCSIQTAANCPGPDVPPNFLGFGTDCEPNCCEQPVFQGGDNCENVTPHDVIVPLAGEDPVVVTITGNNTTASGPDSCLQGQWNAAGGTYTTVDPGWWEAFTIDKCAFVRVDFCCSDPIIEPQWSLIWKGCPCDDAIFTSVNPNNPEEPANRRGGPYCEDDNLWMNYGPLRPDTYYIPVYSVPQGAHGQYQMHITVAGCPAAACCTGDTCLEEDQIGCGDVDGANFLAPPFRIVAVDSCTVGTCLGGSQNGNPCNGNVDCPGGVCQASTCSSGSCCYSTSGALCQDIISGSLANPDNCAGALGVYKGGVRCYGCACSGTSPVVSCRTNSDCPVGSNCFNPGTTDACSGTNLTAPSPCPVCDFETTNRCQRQVPNGYDGARLSDVCAGDCVTDPPESDHSLPGIRAADDFVASVGGQINAVCVWGAMLQQGAGLADCWQSGPPEKFTVTIYNDVGGLPGSAVGTRTTTVVRKGITATSPPATRTIFQWQLALSSPLNVTQGNTYWLEVVNDTDESSGHPQCDWFWALSDPDQGADSGNGMILQDAGNQYTFGDAAFDGADLAWCIDLDNTVPVIKQAACCTCGGGVGSCDVLTLENCTNADGSWQPTEPDCIGVICRNEADAADNCSTDRIAVPTNSATPWNNYCATTDGPATAGNGDCSAGLDAQADLWYTWTANTDCDVVIETCDLGGEVDTMMAIYTNNTGTCPCPTSATSEIDCSDDGCVFVGAGSRTTLQATSGVCYTIRVAGFQGTKGEGVLHIGECTEGGGQPVDPTPAGLPNKPRFISFSITGGTGETAIRIKLVTLHSVVPPYSGAPTIPFTAFQGQSVWVGPPQTFVESNASGIQFRAAQTRCTPHYQDWNTVGLLHVTGAHIAPSSTYHVENVNAACQGVEGTAACQTGGNQVSAGVVAISTTRWGDIETPFNPPDPTAQPNASDIGAGVNKFRGALGAPIKARALLTGTNAFGEINITPDYNFGHIASIVDAFRGLAYPFRMGKCATGTGACTSGSDCTGPNAPPCNLYCPP